MTAKEESYKELLRAKDLKITPKRVGLLTVLGEAQKPLSITELRDKLTEYACVMDNVTLYRALEALIQVQIVRPVDLRHGHVDYELIREGKHHHHLVCEHCGAIADFSWCPEPSLEKTILQQAAGFDRLTDHSVEFFGVCKRCAVQLKLKN